MIFSLSLFSFRNLQPAKSRSRRTNTPPSIAAAAARHAPGVLSAPWGLAWRLLILEELDNDKPVELHENTTRTRRRLSKQPIAAKDPSMWWTLSGLVSGHDEHASALARGHLALSDDIGAARRKLTQLRAWISGSGSGDIQLILAVRYLAARIALTSGDLETCLQESRLGFQSADTCGFGLLAIDHQLMAAHARLAAREPGAVLALTDAVRERAADSTCDYRWALADAWHLRAMAQRLDDHTSALVSAEQALLLRRQLQHPGLCETTQLVAELIGAPHSLPGGQIADDNPIRSRSNTNN